MAEDKAERLRELISEAEEDEYSGLPTFGPFEMVESYGPEDATGDVYIGEEGDIWFHTGNGEDHQSFGDYEDEFVEAVLRAYLSGGSDE